MKFRTKLMSAIVVLCALSFTAGLCINEGLAAEQKGLKVLGKINVKAGTQLEGIVMVGQASTGFMFVAFEDTTIYILEKIAPVAGSHNGGYMADSDGFPHNCPTHGLEPMGPGIILIPQQLVDDGTVEVMLFEQGMPNAGDGSTNGG